MKSGSTARVHSPLAFGSSVPGCLFVRINWRVFDVHGRLALFAARENPCGILGRNRATFWAGINWIKVRTRIVVLQYLQWFAHRHVPGGVRKCGILRGAMAV